VTGLLRVLGLLLRTPQLLALVLAVAAGLFGAGCWTGHTWATRTAEAERAGAVAAALEAEQTRTAGLARQVADRDAAVQTLAERLAAESARQTAATRRLRTQQDGPLAPVLREALRGMR